MLRSAIFVLCLAASGHAAAQGLYRWTDGQGRVHYSSEPPARSAAEVRARVSCYRAHAQPLRESAPAALEAPAGQVYLYAAHWCPYAAKARAYLDKKGIPYVERDVEQSAQAHEEYRRLGGRGVPLILVGREAMDGFSEAGFDALLTRAAQR